MSRVLRRVSEEERSGELFGPWIEQRLRSITETRGEQLRVVVKAAPTEGCTEPLGEALCVPSRQIVAGGKAL